MIAIRQRTRPVREFRAGQRATVARVHHPAFAKDIGKAVIIRRVCGALVWASDDKPAVMRTNRMGREVPVSDPMAVQTVYAVSELSPSEPA
jgi:hypothetical protein